MALPAVLRTHWTHRYPRLQNAILSEYLSPVSRDVDLVRTFANAPKALARTGVAGAVGYMSYKTSKYRQKPIVGLQTATHKRRVSPPSVGVNIPSVSSRRVKNKILTTTKAMPYRRYKRKSNTRSKKYKRFYRKKKFVPLAIPRSKLVRFRLVTTGTLTGSSGALATVAFKANSLNDPTGSWSAALPNSLDQWAAFYQKYIVLGSKVKLRVTPTANTGAGIIGIHLADNGTPLSGANAYKEMNLTKQRILTTQKDYTVLNMGYSAKKFWHLANIKDDSEQEGAFSTTPGDPTDIAYYHVYAQDMNGGNTFTVECQLEMEFICYLCDPINLAASSL